MGTKKSRYTIAKLYSSVALGINITNKTTQRRILERFSSFVLWENQLPPPFRIPLSSVIVNLTTPSLLPAVYRKRM